MTIVFKHIFGNMRQVLIISLISLDMPVQKTFFDFEEAFLNTQMTLGFYIQDLRSYYFWDNNPVIFEF